MSTIFRRMLSNIQDTPFTFYVGLMIIIIAGTALAVIFDNPPTPDINELSIPMPIAPVIDKQDLVSDTFESLDKLSNKSYNDTGEGDAQASAIATSNDYDEMSELALMPDTDTESSSYNTNIRIPNSEPDNK